MAIVKFRDSHQKAEGAIGRLENTSLTCFICNQEDDGKPKSYRLHKCCAAPLLVAGDEVLLGLVLNLFDKYRLWMVVAVGMESRRSSSAMLE